MSKTEKRTSTKGFRAEAVKLVLEQAKSLEEGGASLALPKGTLATWVAAARRGDGPATVPDGRSVAELEYVEIFYNRQRRHARLGHVVPARFAEHFSKIARAA